MMLTLAMLAVAADKTQQSKYALDSTRGLELVNASAEVATHQGRRALHLAPEGKGGDDLLAIVTPSDFHNGVIEAEMIGLLRQGVRADMRGFIGLAFRVQEKGAKYENIFLRPLNARANDQLRRNHTMQYQSVPEYPWNRLRQESPGVYESYCDMVAGAWTHLRIEVDGTRARAYVNHVTQPCLIVNDPKLGNAHGPVGLWANATTDAWFSNLRIVRKD